MERIDEEITPAMIGRLLDHNRRVDSIMAEYAASFRNSELVNGQAVAVREYCVVDRYLEGQR